MIEITTYIDKHVSGIIDLILSIQQKEFNIPVTLETQPDLQKIPEIYQSDNGNFWVAIHNEQVIGTIGLIDIGSDMGVIRKMFVNAAYRGSVYGVGHRLLQTLLGWSVQKGMRSIFLGTVEKLKASHRFYEKNGFVRIAEQELPEQFPRMKVDTLFYKYDIQPGGE